MKSSIKKNNTKKVFVITIVVAFVVLAGLTATAYALKLWPFQTSTQTATNTDVPTTAPAVTDSTASTDKTVIPAEDSGNTGDTVERPTITRASLSGTSVRVSAIFTATTSGTCTVTFKKDGQATITKEAAVVVGSSYYTCNGFLIPISEFPTNGEWTVTVTHTQAGKTATSDEQTVIIE